MTRTGIGYDAHRFTRGRRLILGGVEIPFDRGLAGHSDADVLSHAVADALLGALSLGDIGRHFPDSDLEFKDISSLKLLERVRRLIDNEGWRIGNIDSILVLQEPKIAPHVENMRQNIADALGLNIEQISVKATSTEKMGFEGRGEGVSSQAVCTLHSK